MIQKLISNNEFRNLKSSAWELNSMKWIKYRLLPKSLRENLISIIVEKIERGNFNRLIDIGCGNGWLFNELKPKFKINNDIELIGLDNNPHFIKYLNTNIQFKDIIFHLADIELDNLKCLISPKPTITTSILNLIETPDLGKVFYNVSNIMNKNDIFICIVLNPYIELIRLNKNYSELKNDLIQFRNNKLCYYSKKLILNKGELESEYFGILHRFEDYITNALQNSLYLIDIKEIDPFNELGEESTIYKILIFEKK